MPAFPLDEKAFQNELRSLLPKDVAVACATPVCEDPLLPREAAALHPGAVPKRREDFRLGRAAARRALFESTGEKNVPILRGARGEPLWPPGIIGSITHSGGIAAAAVAHSSSYAGIGIDIEAPSHCDVAAVAEKTCHPCEKKWIFECPDLAEQRLRMAFSAKESLYKALRRHLSQEPDFLDVRLLLDPLQSVLHAEFVRELASPLGALRAEIRFGEHPDSYVMSSVMLW